MNNLKKIFALTLCSAALFVGCEKRHKISLDEANTFALKNYNSVIKLCKNVTVNYNLHFDFDDEKNAIKCCEYIEKYFSLRDAPETSLYSIKDKTLTMDKTDSHDNDESSATGTLFKMKSLGFVEATVEGVEKSRLKQIAETYYNDDCSIYVANSNNIIIDGILTIPDSFDSNDDIKGCKITDLEEQFDDDGCVKKRIITLKKGDVIRDLSTTQNVIFTVNAESTLVATYTYY